MHRPVWRARRRLDEAAALPNSDLRLSRLGLGSWAFGAGKGGSTGLGPQNDRDSVATIHRALALGINWIDTAASYGRGHSERVIARALRDLDRRTFVFTKCGTVVGPGGEERHCLTPSSIRDEIHSSLQRLEVDALDLVYVHWPRPERDLEQAWSTLAQLREVALAWTLRRRGVIGAVVGARDPTQIDGHVGAPGLRLEESDIAELDQFRASFRARGDG